MNWVWQNNGATFATTTAGDAITLWNKNSAGNVLVLKSGAAGTAILTVSGTGVAITTLTGVGTITFSGGQSLVGTSANIIRPGTDAAVDLGSATFRFKDLYLSGALRSPAWIPAGGTAAVTATTTTFSGTATITGAMSLFTSAATSFIDSAGQDLNIRVNGGVKDIIFSGNNTGETFRLASSGIVTIRSDSTHGFQITPVVDGTAAFTSRGGADTAILKASAFQTSTALVALGAGGAATLGNTGGSGPATTTQNTWLRMVDSTGAAFWVPAWK